MRWKQFYFILVYCFISFMANDKPCSASFTFSLNNEFAASKEIDGVLFTPYDKLLISYGADNQVDVWDLKKESIVRKFVSQSSSICSAAIQQEQSFFAAGGKDGMLYIWEYETGKQKHALKASQKAIEAISFSPNGKLIASSGKDKVIRLWNVKMGRKIWELKGHEGTVHSLAFSDDGQTLISAGTDSTIISKNQAQRAYFF
ncbi:MAG: hypothetical protein JRF40_04745 [Deltaproteobacteria bacterium]|nr:hypothetical protein [Deltaproteobacteria bacterium]